MALDTTYLLRYAFVVLISGYHLMELDMIKISFPAFLEELKVIEVGNKKQSISEFSNLYSKQMILGIPSTLFWGYCSDKYGAYKTTVVHLMFHILISAYLGTVPDYSKFVLGSMALSFFSNYVISLSTFMSWIPENKRASFIANSQFYVSVMLQIAPIFAGAILKMSDSGILFRYHMILASLLLIFLLGFIYAFKDYKEEAATGSKKEQAESEDLKGLKGFITILKDKNATALLFLGIYLRLVKKLVDVALHLWAEISISENGLGYDKALLGTYSSIGGILSVIVYLKFANDDIMSMPAQLKSTFLITAGTIFLFPFLAILQGWALNGLLIALILVFNYCFSVLFSVWIGLLNNGVRKEIRSKSFALTLAIRSIVGSYISYLCFELMRWSLSSKSVTNLLGGRLNSALFFWLFTLINLGMYWFFRNLKLSKKEKTYELIL